MTAPIQHQPKDEHDVRLLQQVRPPQWRNPDPLTAYDLVVIGGGTAGLVCAAGAAGLGARVALIERERLGGDCLNTGCVPSKALIRAARVVAGTRGGAALGVPAEARPDFDAVMRGLRARRADIAPHDSAERLQARGVHVFFGEAAFTGASSVSVGGRTLTFRRAVVATGSQPRVPAISGLGDVPFLTSENVFALTRQPRHLAVIGGGPIGCELAQAFALLGSQVTLLEAGPRLLPRDDADAAAVVATRLQRDGVDVRVAAAPTRVVRADDRIRLATAAGDVEADALLVATGRAPRVDGLALDAAGIAWNAEGVRVDDRLRTTNASVYAAGDVCSAFQFTHAADALARLVVRNALFYGRRRASALLIPWCTFTAPEVAHVGMTSEGAAGASAETITVPLEAVDRSLIDGEADGFVRLYHRRGRILGATIVAPHAGELIGLVALAMHQGVGLANLSDLVLPYPTVSLAFKQAGDAYRRNGLTLGVRNHVRRYFAVWRRL